MRPAPPAQSVTRATAFFAVWAGWLPRYQRGWEAKKTLAPRYGKRPSASDLPSPRVVELDGARRPVRAETRSTGFW